LVLLKDLDFRQEHIFKVWIVLVKQSTVVRTCCCKFFNWNNTIFLNWNWLFVLIMETNCAFFNYWFVFFKLPFWDMLSWENYSICL